MGKKSRFMMLFCKKTAIVSGIFVITLCLSFGDANAKLCNRYNPTSAGEFCKASSVQTCREGCYCLGSKRSIEWILVDDYCKNRKTHDKYINSETYGVYLCPEGYTSKAGAKSKEDCYKIENSSSSSTDDGKTVVTSKGKSCSKNKIAGPGLYCGSSLTKECKPGCYCPGNGNGTFTWLAGDVEKGCKERWSKITTELNSKGVFLCPEGYTSNAGAKSQADCYKIEDATSADTAVSGTTCSKSKPAPAGSYCGATITKKCKPGCYCTGGGNFTWAAGDVEKGCKERWNKVTSELNDKGVFLCPAGYTSVEGAGDISDCFLNGHSDIKYQEITCDTDEYLPANSTECATCPNDSYCSGVTNALPSATDQGRTKCPDGQIPSSDGKSCKKTTVECDAGEYLPTNSTDCTSCDGGFVCPGGTLTMSETEPVGMSKCSDGMIPNDTQTACVTAPPTAIKCDAGTYLPAGTTECVECLSRYTCPGGEYMPGASQEDQGITKTPEISIDIELMAFGKQNELKNQCWIMTNPEKFKECVLSGIKATNSEE